MILASMTRLNRSFRFLVVLGMNENFKFVFSKPFIRNHSYSCSLHIKVLEIILHQIIILASHSIKTMMIMMMLMLLMMMMMIIVTIMVIVA